MSADRLRVILIALLAAAAVLAAVGHKDGLPWVVWVSYLLFFGAVGTYFRWRQRLRAKVSDREEKTPE